MAIINTRLSDTNATQVFRAAGSEVVTTIYICNDTAGDAQVNVYCISDDGSTGGASDNIIYSQLQITSHDTYVISTEKLVLDDQDYIQVQANVANAITVTVSSISV